MQFATLDLVRRLEASEAAAAKECTQFLARKNPASGAVCIDCVIELSNVLYRPIESAARTAIFPPGVEIRRAAAGEARSWAETVSRGFAEHFPVTEELIEIMEMFSQRPSDRTYLAYFDGKIAGGAALCMQRRRGILRREYLARFQAARRADGVARGSVGGRCWSRLRYCCEHRAVEFYFASQYRAAGISRGVYPLEVHAQVGLVRPRSRRATPVGPSFTAGFSGVAYIDGSIADI